MSSVLDWAVTQLAVTFDCLCSFPVTHNSTFSGKDNFVLKPLWFSSEWHHALNLEVFSIVSVGGLLLLSKIEDRDGGK